MSCAILLPLTYAQEGSEGDDQDEKIISLNPFVVDSRKDVGYLAGSSLSGSRLSSNLKDLAAPTTAFTEELLRDLAVTDTTALSQYMLNTTFDRGEDGGGQQNSVITDSSQNLKIRGLPGGKTSINFFFADMRLDAFNIARIDQSRGPNSILYGIGQPGGLVNVTTKQAMLGQMRTELAGTIRSWGGTRYEFDHNQPLIKNKLALRVAAVKQNNNSWRNHEYDDANRVFATTTWQITPKTQLRVEGELGKVDKSPKRTYTAADSYTVWRNAGSVVSNTAVAAAGVVQRNALNWSVYDTGSGEMYNWRQRTRSFQSVSPENANIGMALTDFSILPRETVIYGDGYGQINDYDRWFAALTHSFSENLNLEIAAYRLNQDYKNYELLAAFSMELSADTNATLPNGQPNPNAGRAYLEAIPQLIEDIKFDDGYRVSMSYQKDLGKLGRHTLAGVAQFNRSEIDRTRWWQVIMNNPFNTNSPENGNNRVLFRTYVDLNGPSANIVMPNWQNINLNGKNVIGANAGQSRTNIETGWVPTTGTQITTTETTSYIGMLQSAWFDGRLHTVVGLSEDRQDGYYSTLARGAAFGPFANGAYYSQRATTPDLFKATNKTFSAVYHVNDWFSLTYNRADNASLPQRTAIMDTPTGRPPTPKGISRDYGFKLDLLDHRVYVTATYYETAAEKDLAFSGVRGGEINPIWTSLDDAGVLASDGLTYDQVQHMSNVNTFDSSGKGFELEMIANLTDQWRLFANFSDNKIVRSNIGEEARAYIAEHRPYWESHASTPFSDPSANVATVGDYLTVLDQIVQQELIVPDGGLLRGQSRQLGNLRTSYRFDEGVVKGLTVGGGMRYRGKAVTAYDATVDTSGNIIRKALYNDPQTYFDLSLGYRLNKKIFGIRSTWSFQLNVNNVFNYDKLIPLVQTPQGAIVSYRFETPREFIFTTRVSF